MPTVTMSDEAIMRAAFHEAFERDLALLAAATAWPGGADAQTRGRWARFKYLLRIHQRADQTYLWPVLRVKAARADLALLDVLADERQALAAPVDAIDAALEFPVDPDRAWSALSKLMIALARHHRHETRLAEAAVLLTSTELLELYWEPRRLTGIKGAGLLYPWLLDGAPRDVRDSIMSHLPPTDRLLYRTLWQPRYVKAAAGESSLKSRSRSRKAMDRRV
ncbi:hypothetical protein ACFY05_27290 [Microtetraspora fusca]|uniref:Hemerythrin domain-containing protein n=1 Tax=Microtetraspora fusca TaxID=1997 RepID=A0ABW6VCB5_MICFU